MLVTGTVSNIISLSSAWWNAQFFLKFLSETQETKCLTPIISGISIQPMNHVNKLGKLFGKVQEGSGWDKLAKVVIFKEQGQSISQKCWCMCI